jgi:hypothetical protein
MNADGASQPRLKTSLHYCTGFEPHADMNGPLP